MLFEKRGKNLHDKKFDVNKSIDQSIEQISIITFNIYEFQLELLTTIT